MLKRLITIWHMLVAMSIEVSSGRAVMVLLRSSCLFQKFPIPNISYLTGDLFEFGLMIIGVSGIYVTQS